MTNDYYIYTLKFIYLYEHKNREKKSAIKN